MRIAKWAAPGIVVISLATPLAAQRSAGIVPLVVKTSLGDIGVDIDSAHAPRTATNFLRYVDAGRFRGGQFHRTVTLQNQPDSPVKIEVIQGSVAPERVRDDFPPIAMEGTRTTGLRHVDGTLSMARAGANSATSSFFITIGPQPELDAGGKRNPDGEGFAAFGRVTSGMEIVRAIQRAPANGQALTPAIRITDVVRR
ncbi:MAG: peptidylprolyl isomerase [Gemmatimonadales bacterium]